MLRLPTAMVMITMAIDLCCECYIKGLHFMTLYCIRVSIIRSCGINIVSIIICKGYHYLFDRRSLVKVPRHCSRPSIYLLNSSYYLTIHQFHIVHAQHQHLLQQSPQGVLWNKSITNLVLFTYKLVYNNKEYTPHNQPKT